MSAMSAQVEDLRDEGLDDLVDELAEMVGADQLQDWEIDFDDITSLVISEPGGRDYLTLLGGVLSIEDIEEALDDDGFRDDTYQETDIWTERRGDVALAFPAEDVLVIGAEKNVEKAIDTLKGDGRSLGDDEAVSQLIERYEDALVYTVIDDCYYRGCKMAGLGIMVEERDLIGMMVFDCRNEDAAFDAENDIEDILEDRIEDLEINIHGTVLVAIGEVDDKDLSVSVQGLSIGESGWAAFPAPRTAPLEPAPRFTPAVAATATVVPRFMPTVAATAAPTARPQPTAPPAVAKPQQSGTVAVASRNLGNGSGPAASVTDHWREVPAIRDIRIFDIPETAARVAMLETGEAQISGELPFRDVVRLQREGFKLQRGSGLAHERGVFFSGNYWETEHPITGRLLVRPREQKPWIGFIEDPASEDPASMESARLVRWAGGSLLPEPDIDLSGWLEK